MYMYILTLLRYMYMYISICIHIYIHTCIHRYITSIYSCKHSFICICVSLVIYGRNRNEKNRGSKQFSVVSFKKYSCTRVVVSLYPKP